MCLSKIKCKIGIHKWEYSYQDFQIIFNVPSKYHQKFYPPRIESIKVRVCKSFYKKQRKSHKWVSCELSTQENRDKLLSELNT
jgi:hypothetical protein